MQAADSTLFSPTRTHSLTMMEHRVALLVVIGQAPFPQLTQSFVHPGGW